MLNEEIIQKLRTYAVNNILKTNNDRFWDGYIMAIDTVLEINELRSE